MNEGKAGAVSLIAFFLGTLFAVGGLACVLGVKKILTIVRERKNVRR